MRTASILVLAHLRWQYQFASDVIAGMVANEGQPPLHVIARNADGPLDEVLVRKIRPHAVVGDSNYPETAAFCQREGIVFIDLTGSCDGIEPVHRISPDDDAIGRMAADYLREAGYTRFAFVGFSDQNYSARRRRGFDAALSGHPLPALETPLSTDLIGLPESETEAFIATLPRPCGIFACSDLRALGVLAALRRLRRRVPEEAGLVGVDVDLALRRLSGWAFPSIDQAAWFQGWQASQWVRELVRTPSRQRTRKLLMTPMGVVDPLPIRPNHRIHPVIDDLFAALERHYAHPNALACALAEIPLSRRAVEQHTRHILGASPLDLLHRRRRKAALALLADGSLTLAEVARRVGFEYQGDFSRFIKRTLGVPPGVIRLGLAKRL